MTNFISERGLPRTVGPFIGLMAFICIWEALNAASASSTQNMSARRGQLVSNYCNEFFTVFR